MMTSLKELERFLDRRATPFEKALQRVARAQFLDRSDYNAALSELAELIRETLILADLHGRKRLLMETDAIKSKGSFAASPIAPNLEFDEAIANLVTREPRLAQSAEEVAILYNTDHVFAMARSSSEKLTKRVQEIVTDMIRKGEGAAKTEREILDAALEESHEWSNAYAATVYRTNASTAYANGRMEQAKDPDVREVIPALEYVGEDDARTRPNHHAAFGLVASVDDPVWNRLKPPLGYNCRCSVDFVSIFELERRGLIKNGKVIRYEPPGFQNAHPDGPPFSTGRGSF